MMPNIASGMAAFNITDDHNIGLTSCWPDQDKVDPELASAIDLAITRRASVISSREAPVPLSKNSNLIIAYPLLEDGELAGVVGVSLTARQEQQGAVIQLLQWGTAWLQMLARLDEQSDTMVPPALFECLSSSLTAPDTESALKSAATILARELPCERVTIGTLKRGRVEATALSHSASFAPHSNFIRAIESAMQEAVTEGGTLSFPPLNDDQGRPLEAHSHLASLEEKECICTLVLRRDAQVIGAACFERVVDSPFDESTVALCEQIGLLLGPVIGLRQRESRSFLTRMAEEVIAAPLRRLFGARNLGMKLAVLILLLLLGLAGFSTGDFRVTAPAGLEGVVQQVIVAPFDGYLAQTHIRAGETVKSGQVVARLDERELNLEYQKWRGKREEYAKHYRKALASLDHSEAHIFKTQQAQADAQLALLKEQIDRTRLVAPFDGLIISGDLSQSVGTPVERGQVLFEVAPLDGYRIALQIDERDIQEIEPGQKGILVLSAMPDTGIEFSVESVASIILPEEKGQAFRVEGTIANEADTGTLRPGMLGIGKVMIGERNNLWIWTRRLVGWVQLRLWSWLP